MNYFELHVGDYDAATAHLSMLEDAAYGRMLRVYYRTEAPLPREVKQVCRLVRAQSKPERDAVEQVLQEFFELADDGWHQARADAEIARFQEGEPEREARKANEETRLQRHRLERAALFKLLNDNGQHAPWNTKIEELRRLAEPFKAGTATAPETPAPPLPATAPATPATATQTPDTRHQYPVVNLKPKNTTSTTDTSPPVQPPNSSSSSKSAEAGKGERPLAWAVFEWETARGKNAKSFMGGSEQTKAWTAAGVTEAQMRQAYDLAVAQREADKDPAPINVKFLDLFVAKVMNPREPGSAVTVKAWYESAPGIEAKGRELGIDPPDPLKGGFPAFKARVFAAAGLTAEA